jgi:EAL domain-containing protein (putative c-di-GMP-specific phosphodiesterase class I)
MSTGGFAISAQAARHGVLVADDDEALLRVLVRALGAADLEVVPARDGLQARELLMTRSFDAVLTDVGMPGMSGMEVLKAVRAHDLDVPVLLMTGAPSVDSAAEAMQFGACAYIMKPVALEELKRTVRHAVDLNQLAKAKREAIELYAPEQPHAGDRVGLEVTFERALDSIWMAYQPIIDAATRTVVGYESLLRSSEPALPNPGAMLTAAERLGRIHELGRRVRGTAPEPMGGAPPGALLFVNLHPRDLEDDALASPSAPLASMASRVVLEITERASLDDVSDAHSRVAKLRELGFRIAIDDLGAGYAGLTAFAQLEPEFVKLDMTLVRDVDESPVKQKLVRTMTSLCRDMGITVVAEGIETIAERGAIIDLGCDLLQGYLFARPGRPFPAICW